LNRKKDYDSNKKNKLLRKKSLSCICNCRNYATEQIQTTPIMAKTFRKVKHSWNGKNSNRNNFIHCLRINKFR